MTPKKQKLTRKSLVQLAELAGMISISVDNEGVSPTKGALRAWRKIILEVIERET